jgi:hypothetical protein
MVTLSRRMSPLLILSVNLSGIQSINLPQRDPYPLTGLSAGVDMRWRVTRWIDVDLGVQGYWQKQDLPSTLVTSSNTQIAATALSQTASEIGYLSVTLHAPRLRF